MDGEVATAPEVAKVDAPPVGDAAPKVDAPPSDGKARGPDGKFAPKAVEEPKPPAWGDLTKTIADEKVRGFAERFASHEDLAKAALELRRQATTRDGWVRPPYEGMTEDETKAWRKATGVPDAPESYAIKLPDDALPTDQDKEWWGGVLKEAHEAGVPRAGLEKVVGAYFGRMAAQQEAMEAALQAEKDRGETALRQLWGPEYDANVALAARVSSRYGSPEMQQLMEQVGLADHPLWVRHQVNVGRFVALHDPLVAMSSDTAQEGVEAVMEEYRKRLGDGTIEDPKFQQRLSQAYHRRYPE